MRRGMAQESSSFVAVVPKSTLSSYFIGKSQESRRNFSSKKESIRIQKVRFLSTNEGNDSKKLRIGEILLRIYNIIEDSVITKNTATNRQKKKRVLDTERWLITAKSYIHNLSYQTTYFERDRYKCDAAQ